jgi:hypothetical protein
MAESDKSAEEHKAGNVETALGKLGLIIGLVASIFGLLQISNDTIRSAQQDEQLELESADKFYIDSSERIIKAPNQLSDQILEASFIELISRPLPDDKSSSPYKPFLSAIISNGLEKICQDRQFAIASHIAMASQGDKDAFTNDALQTSTKDPKLSANTICQVNIKRANEDAVKASQSIVAAAPPPAQPTASPVVTHFNFPSVLTHNPNPKGWDIDVLPCPAPDQMALGRKIAEHLGAIADAKQKFAGQRLGNIRLGQGGRTKNVVIFDPDERGLADALVKEAQSQSKKPIQFTAEPNDQAATPYYLSIFVCGPAS